jgi:hypothetical protein
MNPLIKSELSGSKQFPKPHQLANKSPVYEPVGGILYSNHNTGHGSMGFNVCPFWSCFGVLLFLLFRMGLFTLCHQMLEVCRVFFDFYRGSQLRDTLSLTGDFGLGLSNNAETLDTWGKELIHFLLSIG